MMIIEKAVVTGISISPDRKRIRCETESLARNYEFWASPHIGGGPGNIQGLFCEMQLGDEIELIGIPVASWEC